MNDEKNRGFSLIEILIAIAMMAIVIVPILQTFITSARINRNARQTMIETDVAQTLMEGFADKSFSEIRSTAGAIAAGVDISGDRVPFSSINDNAFNRASTANVTIGSVSGGLSIDSRLSAVSRNQITWDLVVYDTVGLVSNNAVSMSMNQVFAGDISSNFIAANNLDPSRKLIATYSVGSDTNTKVLFIAYGNIEYGGYHYDAIISFVPMAKTASDTYYTYDIFLTLYEYNPNNPGERFSHILMKMEGGIMAGQ